MISRKNVNFKTGNGGNGLKIDSSLYPVLQSITEKAKDISHLFHIVECSKNPFSGKERSKKTPE